jgi:O-glycosyl hydrolase
VINDLGISIWRNEYYSEESNQDANWAKQLPVVQGLKRIADANRVPLKFIYTVWTAPSSMKCTVESVQAGQNPCTRHPDGLKNGGTLDPSKYNAYAQWLIAGVKKYQDAGVDLYALSPQNEPLFVESYNSCVYATETTSLNAYSRMLKAVAPAIKQAYPNVKIYGTENMLGLEGQPWTNISYSAAMDSTAWPSFDVLAYHGYQDGVAPTEGSQLAQYWINVRDNYNLPQNKPCWMTETSGYVDTWGADNGARALGYAIYSALAYGRLSAWVWWQGSELGATPNEYTLMNGTQELSKRYYVSKQFYRFIRPGARMVSVTTSDSSLFVVAFQHPTMNSFTLVVINTAAQDKPLVLGGANIPGTYSAYRTSASENCVSAGSVTNGSIALRADSITTLVSGNVYE